MNETSDQRNAYNFSRMNTMHYDPNFQYQQQDLRMKL